MNPIIYIGAAAGFLGGYFGYILIRFTVLPIFGYKKLKKQTAKLLTHAESSGDPSSDKSSAKDIRTLSVNWSDYCTEKLPNWYAIYLNQRLGETPVEVAAILMKLSGTQNPDHAKKQIEKIRNHLQIK